MGTSHSQIYNDDLFTHFKRDNWRRVLDLGLYELWEDTQSGELCEAYKLDYVPQENELQHYRFRHYNQNADNFVQIRYVDVEKKQSLCYHGESYVLTEFIPVKLSDMYDLNFPQTYLILKSAFRAFHTMEAFHGPFIPTQELIGINLVGKPKIWLNKNHSKNKAEKEIKAEIWQKHLGEVSQNVRRVIEIVQDKLKNKSFPKEFRDYFFDNIMNFSQASEYVQQFCDKNKIQMPLRIEYSRYIADQEVSKIVNEYLSKHNVGVMVEEEGNKGDGSVRDGKERKLVREESAVKPFSRIGSHKSFIQHQQVHYLPAQNIHYKPHSSQVIPIQRVFSPTNATQKPVSFQIPVSPANFGPVYRVQQRKLSNSVVFVRPQVRTQKTITIVPTNGVPHIRKVLNNNVQGTPMHIGNHVSFIPPSKIAEFQQPVRTQFSDVKQVHLPIDQQILAVNQQQQHPIQGEINHEVVGKQIYSRQQQPHEESIQFQNGYINDGSQIEIHPDNENDNHTSEPDWEEIRRQEQERRERQNQLLTEQDHHDFQIRDEQVENYQEQNDNGQEKHENAEISLIKQSQKRNISQFEGHYAMFENYAMGNKINQQQHEKEQPQNIVLSSLEGRDSKLIESKNVVSDEEPEEEQIKVEQSTQDHNQEQELNNMRKFSSKNTSINRGTKQESSGTMVIHESKENIYQGVLQQKFDKIVIANAPQDVTEGYCESRDGQEHGVNHEDFEHTIMQAQANAHEQQPHEGRKGSYDDSQWKKLHDLQSQKQIALKDQKINGYLGNEEQAHHRDEQYKDFAQQQLAQFEQQQREYVQQQRMRQQSLSQSSEQYRYYYDEGAAQVPYKLQQGRQMQGQRETGYHQQLQGLDIGREGQLRSGEDTQRENKSTRRFNQYDNLHFRNESEELYQYTPVESLHKKEMHQYSYQPVPRPHYNSGVEEITQIQTHQDIENYIRNKYANMLQPTITVTQKAEPKSEKAFAAKKRSTKDYSRAMTFAKPSQQDQEEPQVNTNQYDDNDQKRVQQQQKQSPTQDNKTHPQVVHLSLNGDFLDVGNLQKSLDSKFNKQIQQNQNISHIQQPKLTHNIHGSQGSQEDGMNIAALDQRLQKFEERQSMEREKSQLKLQSSYAEDLSPRNQNQLNFNDLDNIVQLMDKKIQQSQNKQRDSYHEVKDYNLSEESKQLFGNIRLETSINQVSNDFSLKNTTILDKDSSGIISNSKPGSNHEYFQNYGLGLQELVKGEYKNYQYQSISRLEDQNGINSGSKVLNESHQSRGVSRKSSYRSNKNIEDAKRIADKISDKYEKYITESSASGKPFVKKSYYDSGASIESSKNKAVGYADYSSKYNAKDARSNPSNNNYNSKISSYLNPIEELNGENNPSSSYRQKVVSKSIRSQLSNPIQNNLENISKFSGSGSMIGSKKLIAGENSAKGSKVSYSELRDLLWR